MIPDDRKKIINFFLKKNILITRDDITKFESLTKTELQAEIKNKVIQSGSTISDNELIILLNQNVIEPNIIINKDNPVEIVYNYDKASKKRDIQDFVCLFNNRYQAIKKILLNRADLQNAISINRLFTKTDKDSVAIIGIISEKQLTKNENIILTVEDPTGSIKVLIHKNNTDLYEFGKDLVLDEVIGITGTNSDSIIFSNNIFIPDIPFSKELKKCPTEVYSVFIGDTHFGHKNFYHKEFDKFIEWINGRLGTDEQKIMASKVKYMFLAGDLVEGVGIHPGQAKDLEIDDIYMQYEHFAKILKKIPTNIKIIICPGNHDAMRIAEPQPPLYKDFAKAIYDLPNTIMVSNPAIVNIEKQNGFEGFDVMIYHGFSFIYYGDKVESIRSNGGVERPDLIMKFLLSRRHLAPTHTSNQYIPEIEFDPMLIEKIPDFFVSGHIHRATVSTYRNITLLNCSSWIAESEYQEKFGLKPQPTRAFVANLKTREVKVIKFQNE